MLDEQVEHTEMAYCLVGQYSAVVRILTMAGVLDDLEGFG